MRKSSIFSIIRVSQEVLIKSERLPCLTRAKYRVKEEVQLQETPSPDLHKLPRIETLNVLLHAAPRDGHRIQGVSFIITVQNTLR